MNISLRKAHALQQSITELIRGISLVSTVSINDFEDADAKLFEAHKTLVNSAFAIEKLYEAFYTIRQLVGEANAKEVNGLLALVALKEKLIQLYGNLSNQSPRTEISVIKGKLSKISAQVETDRYSRLSNEVTTNVLPAAGIEQYKSAIAEKKKEKQKLQDKILELNISTKIELPDNVVATLTDADLI